jgi:hypothetical protein
VESPRFHILSLQVKLAIHPPCWKLNKSAIRRLPCRGESLRTFKENDANTHVFSIPVV